MKRPERTCDVPTGEGPELPSGTSTRSLVFTADWVIRSGLGMVVVGLLCHRSDDLWTWPTYVLTMGLLAMWAGGCTALAAWAYAGRHQRTHPTGTLSTLAQDRDNP